MLSHKPEFIIESHRRGWLITAPLGEETLPISALTETQELFPKNAVIAPGIAHHYTQVDRTGYGPTLLAICTPQEKKLWEADIKDWLFGREPEEQWWKGTDVGLSAAAMYAVLGKMSYRHRAWEMTNGKGPTPNDADDLGRCLRLLEAFPEWNNRLQEVADAYPKTHWPIIISQWDTLKTEKPAQQTALLRLILETPLCPSQAPTP